MSLGQREFLKRSGLAALAVNAVSLELAARPLAGVQASDEQPDHTIRVGTGLVELAPDHVISTTIYNGQFPDPLLRVTEGKRVMVDIHSQTDTPSPPTPRCSRSRSVVARDPSVPFSEFLDAYVEHPACRHHQS